MIKYREQALIKLKENNISMLNMEVYIQGYIDGRIDRDLPKDEKINIISDDMVPVNELWFKNNDGSITKTVFIEGKESGTWVEDMKKTFRDLGY